MSCSQSSTPSWRCIDTVGSDAGTSWTDSFGNRGRNPQDPDLARLLVEQQYIQYRNHYNQLASQVTDSQPPSEFGQSGTDMQGDDKKESLDVDTEGRDSRITAEGIGEVETACTHRYGAMRIKNWSGGEEQHNEGGLGLSLMTEEEFRGAVRQKEKGSPQRGGRSLRQMFATADEDEQSVESSSTLRERRAKPPISITLDWKAQTVDEMGRSTAEAVIMGGAIALRKKRSKTNILSPSLFHKPPPCPPPTAPLPDLPPLMSSPIIAGASSAHRFSGWPSTPFSPTLSSQPLPATHQHHEQARSQLQSPIQHQPATDRWSNLSSAHSSLLTPPLTGVPSLVHDHQPSTPASVAGETAVTPVRGNAEEGRGFAKAGKFDRLLEFLSFKDRREPGEHVNDTGGAGLRAAKVIAGAVEDDDALTIVSGGPEGVMYGLAL